MGRCRGTFKMSESDGESSQRFTSRSRKPRLHGKCWTETAATFPKPLGLGFLSFFSSLLRSPQLFYQLYLHVMNGCTAESSYKAGFCFPLIDWSFPSPSGNTPFYTPSVNTS